MPERKCRNCGEDIKDSHASTVYCNANCRMIHKNLGHTEAWLNPKPRPKPKRHQIYSSGRKNGT